MRHRCEGASKRNGLRPPTVPSSMSGSAMKPAPDDFSRALRMKCGNGTADRRCMRWVFRWGRLRNISERTANGHGFMDVRRLLLSDLDVRVGQRERRNLVEAV